MAEKGFRLARLILGAVASLMLFPSQGAQAQGSPATVGSWGPVFDVPVGPTHSILLPTGKVLYFGEFEKGNTPFLWDPITNATTSLSYPGFNIFCSGHSHLDSGRVFITGGHIDSHVGEPKSVIFDPYSLSWLPVPPMNDGRWYPTATTLPNGDVLVVGGETDGSGANNPVHQIYIPATNTWRDLNGAAADLPYYTRQFVAPDGKLVIVTPRRRSYLIDPIGAGSFSNLGLANHTSSKTYGGAVMYDDGKILAVGGGSPPTATAELLNLNSSLTSWRTVAPMSIARRQHNTVLLPDGRVLVIGGSSGSSFDDRTRPVHHSEVWDPDTETWTTWASQAMYRGYHSTALLLPDGRIFTGGGRHDDTAEIFSPPYLFQGTRPIVTSAPVFVDPGATFMVMTPDASQIRKVHLIRLGATTHAFDQNQRLSRLDFTAFSGGLMVDAPSSNQIAPPGHYMLFLINQNGVPSVAEIIRLNNVSAAPIGLSHPSGGEVFVANDVKTVQWWAHLPTTRLDLAYSTDGGATWTPIATDIANSGSFSWTVPPITSSNVYVRVSDHDDPTIWATNLDPFSIYIGPGDRVISFGSSWKYHDSGTYPGSGWITAGFSDGSWPSGNGELGYGDGDETTILQKTSPSQTSVYFRKKVSITAAQAQGVELSVVYDDGIAVWINGNLVLERNLGRGLDHERYATQSAENETFTTMLPPGLLQAGTNIIAAMVKQNGGSSPDLSFDLELRLLVPQQNEITLTYPQGGETFSAGDEVWLDWTTAGYVPQVDLHWSSDRGATWQVIATSVPNQESYQWFAPAYATTDAMVRVSKTGDGTVSSQSGAFAVSIPQRWQVFPMGSVWKYFDDGSNPGSSWNLASFSDSSWASGAGELGYGDGDETTLLQKTTPSQTSVYFRKTFSLTGPVAGGEIHTRFDDAIAVWINGTLVMTANMGSLAHDKYAADGGENEELYTTIPGSVFQTGTNLIAVMVKQTGKSSPDLSFDLGLTVDSLP